MIRRSVVLAVCVTVFGSSWASAQSIPSDALDLSQTTFYGEDPRVWPATVALDAVAFSAQTGLEPRFNRAALNARWPDKTPPGWNGPLQFGLVVFVLVRGRYYGATLQSFWSDYADKPRLNTGAHPLTPPPPGTSTRTNNWQANWAYDNFRWGEMASYVPARGDQIGVMLVAGSLRFGEVEITVRERSNVLLCALDFETTCTAAVTAPPQPPPDVPVPPRPPSNPPPTGGGTISGDQVHYLIASMQRLETVVQSVSEHLAQSDQWRAAEAQREIASDQYFIERLEIIQKQLADIAATPQPGGGNSNRAIWIGQIALGLWEVIQAVRGGR
jgi:hypothetical protein